MAAFDRLEKFVEGLPGGAIEDAISVFAMPSKQVRAA
jgi:hypothetical protein